MLHTRCVFLTNYMLPTCGTPQTVRWFIIQTSSVAVCVWSKRSAADLNCPPVVPTPPAGLWLTSAELWGETVSSAPTNWSSSAGSWDPVRHSARFWTDCGYEKTGTDSAAGLGKCTFGEYVEIHYLNFSDSADVSENFHFHCVRHSEHQRTHVSERNNHLLAALQFAASPAGTIWLWMSTPTRCFQGRDVNTATAGSPSASLGLRYSPRLPFHPLWPGKPASSPSPPRRSVFLRGSCRGGGTDAAGLPPGPCCPGFLGYQGGACLSLPTCGY